MDTVPPRLGRSEPGSMPSPVGIGRLAGSAEHPQEPTADTAAGRNVLRHVRDVVADLMQRDPES